MAPRLRCTQWTGGGLNGYGGGAAVWRRRTCEKYAHLVTVSVTVIGVDGKELHDVPTAHYRWDGQPEVGTTTESGAEWARRGGACCGGWHNWATPPGRCTRPFDAMLRVHAILRAGPRLSWTQVARFPTPSPRRVLR